jgi:hypothetical protein
MSAMHRYKRAHGCCRGTTTEGAQVPGLPCEPQQGLHRQRRSNGASVRVGADWVEYVSTAVT